MDYSELLKKAMENRPESAKERDRFQIPTVSGHVEGQKTVIKNFTEIANHLHRDPEHLSKFLLKELATPGSSRNQQFIFGRRLAPQMINEKIVKYADMFVFCDTCGKPETILEVKDATTHLRCNACGAKYVVKTI